MDKEMPEKPPAFTVMDRRKFTIDGDVREDSNPQEPAIAEEVKAPEQQPGPRLITTSLSEDEEAIATNAEAEEEAYPELTAEQATELHTAYQESSRQLDAVLRQANPGMAAETGTVAFEHVIQSIYLSAMMAMGAGTEEGQKPRIDIIGARQSVDMLAVLQDKTTGNLTEKERLMLQNALFELRMMFLEITNAIAQSAQRKPGK
jgi:hypothetical protein